MPDPDVIDRLLRLLDEEGSPDGHETPLVPARVELDAEDTTSLLQDCWAFARDIEASSRSDARRAEARALIERLQEALSWYRLQ